MSDEAWLVVGIVALPREYWVGCRGLIRPGLKISKGNFMSFPPLT